MEQICELCCGAGGMALGFQPFFEIAQAIDISEPVIRTYGSNHRETSARRQDIRNVTGVYNDFYGITGIIGGPPCQGSSILNKKRCADDPRNGLMDEFMRVVSEVKPKFFVMENVPTVPAEKKNDVIRIGKYAGYNVSSVYMNAADYGAAQTRKRWIVVGTKDTSWTIPGIKSSLTVKDAFQTVQNNWGFMNCSSETLSNLMNVTGEWTGATGKFRNMIRLSWDRPAPAVVNLKKVYMVHPDEVRNISLAEGASLQGFPNDYIWKGKETEIAQMIANAMPSQFARSIAETLV